MIRLRKIEIRNFGKLSDAVYDLSGGVQVICGGNEAGKSTIQLFIKSMLYGVSKRGGRDEVKERERILPWSGESAGGSLFIKKDERELIICRTFGLRPSLDDIKVYDGQTGARVPQFEHDNCGELLLGMSETVFLKTLCVRQLDIPIRGKDDELQKKLIGLAEGGAMNVSFSDAKGRLSLEHKRLKAESGREKPGLIDKKNEELLDLRREIYMATEVNRERRLRQKKTIELKEVLEKEEKYQRELMEKQRTAEALRSGASVKRIEECRRRMQEILSAPEINRFKNTAPEEIEELNLIENKILALDRKNGMRYDKEERFFRKKYIRLSAAVAGCILALLSLAGIIKAKPLLSIITGAAAALIFFGIFIYRMGNTDKHSKKNEAVQYEEYLRRKNEYLKRWDAKTVPEVISAYGIYGRLHHEIEMLREICRSELGGRSFSEFAEQTKKNNDAAHVPGVSASDHFETELLEQNEKCRNLRNELEKIQRRDGYEEYHDRDVAALVSKANHLEAECEKLYERYCAVCLAEEKLGEVYRRFQSDFTPILYNKIMPLFGSMTENLYTDLRVSDDLAVKFTYGGEFRRCESLSTGAYDRIYLSARMAIAAALSEKSFLCFDDVLTNLDDVWAKRAAKTIASYAKRENMQIILFTCHSRDAENFRQYSANVLEI